MARNASKFKIIPAVRMMGGGGSAGGRECYAPPGVCKLLNFRWIF
jgi:hypothetical protein